MQVRILIGANAYAHIKTETTSLDVLLLAGRSPATSLRESAEEMREQAARLTARAELVERAATLI